MSARAQCVLWLVVFMVLEFLPFPVLGLVLLRVVLTRPQWFKRLIDRLYSEP
jgi:hypothetical protein